MTTKTLSRNGWVLAVAFLAAVLVVGSLLPQYARAWIQVIFSLGISFYLARFVVRSLRRGHFDTAPDRQKDPLAYWIAISFFALLAGAMAVGSGFELIELLKAVR